MEPEPRAPSPQPTPPKKDPGPASGGGGSASAAKKKELKCLDFKAGEEALAAGLNCAPSQLKGAKLGRHPDKTHRGLFVSPDWVGMLDTDAPLAADVDRLATTRAEREAKKAEKFARSKVKTTLTKNVQKRLKDAGDGADQAAIQKEEEQKLGIPDVAQLAAQKKPANVTLFKGRFPERGEYWYNRNVRQAGVKRLEDAELALVTQYKRSSAPTDKTFEQALEEAHNAELAGAEAKVEAMMPAIKRGFVVAEEERIKFEFSAWTGYGLKQPTGYDESTFSKPTAPKGRPNSGVVGPEVDAFIQKIDSGNFQAGTYSGHSWGAYSIDVTLRDGQDDRGFYKHASAVEFFLAADRAASQANVKWRALYNDFDVANEVNPQVTAGRIVFKVDHGPEPYVLHIHLDVEPIAGPEEDASPTGPTP